ncbi:hypothetical protein D9615_005542 [Tricholomella constricta]|uniref:Uncharacterized protein n=1 Tax=Tricholomella constricta TaxID=117010 RepID=A0A8H5HE65_9AGAR|nr:hypothetical protein D9615_005542 [Tricholomella constricta]
MSSDTAYRAFNSMPRANNPYLPILHSSAANSFASLIEPLSPVRPSRRASPKKTPSPGRKARSSVSTSIFGAFVNTLKGKRRAKQQRSPTRSPAGASALVIRKMPSSPGLTRRRRQASLPYTPSKFPDDTDMGFAAGPGPEDDEAGDHAQYITVMTRRRRLTIATSPDPFKTPPRTPIRAPPLSPVELNESSESVRNRRKRDRERSFAKSLQILGVEAGSAVRQQYGSVWEV